MLILTRKPGESFYIGDNVKITIVELKGHQIRVGIEAPKELRIYREEIYVQILEENRKAAAPSAEELEQGLAAFGLKSGDDEGGKKRVGTLGVASLSSLSVKTRSGEVGVGFNKVGGAGSGPGDQRSTELKGPEVVVKRKRNKE